MSAVSSPYQGILAQLLSTLQAPRINGAGLGPAGGQFASMLNQANAANAARGQDILELLGGQGQYQEAQNQQEYQNRLGTIDQDMMNKGLANTTVGSNLKQGASDELALQNEQVSENAAKNIAQMANSFTQQAPSMNLLAQLVGKGGGGGGGGGIIQGPEQFQLGAGFGQLFQQWPQQGF